MEPAEAINMVEVVLRDLVRLVLGDAWMQSPKVDLTRLKQKRDEDKAKRRGTLVSDDLLAYTEFTQLKEIIMDNWDQFAPALGKKKYIDAYLDRLNGFRNPVAHSRQLREFECDLVNGIVGELRNLVVLYRSAQGPDMQYYPKIEQVTDSFGNNPVAAGGDPSDIRLEVGETVTFECRGWDPQDRELIWQLTVGRNSTNLVEEARGSEVILTAVITEEMVGERLLLEVTMMSEGKYHRYPYGDDFCDFYYAVNPPRQG